MLHYYIFFILIISSKCRLYEHISIIQETILEKIKKSNLTIIINGTNGFAYKLTKKNIFLTYISNTIISRKYIAQINNPKITILFNLSIYEYTNNIYDLKYLNNAIVTDKLVTINIYLNFIKFYKASEDFSFDVSYEIENITNNITIYYDDLIELDSFKYLFFEEKSILYDNKTLNDHIKYTILNTLINNTKNILIEYPEIDSFYYFKTIINIELTTSKFFIDYYCRSNEKVIINAMLTSYNYQQIIKNDTHLILKDLKFDLELFTLCDMFTEDCDDDNYKVQLKIDDIIISRKKNYEIIYGKADDQCNLEIFTNVTKKAREQVIF